MTPPESRQRLLDHTERLLTVIGRFTLGEFVGLFPGVRRPVRAGDIVEIRRPDGSRFQTYVEGLSRGWPFAPTIVLPCLVIGADVPRGSEVWRLPGHRPTGRPLFGECLGCERWHDEFEPPVCPNCGKQSFWWSRFDAGDFDPPPQEEEE